VYCAAITINGMLLLHARAYSAAAVELLITIKGKLLLLASFAAVLSTGTWCPIFSL
jgi:hypothetical protein